MHIFAKIDFDNLKNWLPPCHAQRAPNQFCDICRLGWFKMHDVFKYWLPGDFWEDSCIK